MHTGVPYQYFSLLVRLWFGGKERKSQAKKVEAVDGKGYDEWQRRKKNKRVEREAVRGAATATAAAAVAVSEEEGK